MRVLVTGGAGFIGANLVRKLVGAGHDVVVLDDLSTGHLANLDAVPDIDVRIGSLVDRRAVEAAVWGTDAVVHLGALGSVPRSVAEPLVTHAANVNGTLTLLEACRAHQQHVILASSSSVYGRNPTLPKHEGLVPMPVSPYAVSKLACEQYALAYSVTYGVPVLVFRFFNVFGPFQRPGHVYAAAIPRFVEAALSQRPVTVFGDGFQTRDFTYVGSVIQAVTAALDTRAVSDTPINLAFGGRFSVLDVLAHLEKIMDCSIDIDYHEPRVGEVQHSQADTSRLLALLPGLSPMAFEDGLRETVAWLRDFEMAQLARRVGSV